MNCVSPDREFDRFFLSRHGHIKQAVSHMFGPFEERVYKKVQ